MIPPELLLRYQSVRDNCQHSLMGQPAMSMPDQLDAIARQAREYDAQDVYGKGELITSFEDDIAQLLGKESAVFLPSGTMAQCIALRLWADRADSNRVGFHPTSHLELHEHGAYQALYGLESVLIGDQRRVVSLDDLAQASPELAAVLLELPMREIGGQLPEWQDLQAQSEWARARGVALHMDGARLWQCPPYYDRSLAEIAALFDSVYVSFYKDMGGIAGAALAGPADFIESARLWIRRAGGNLYSLFPYVLAARAGMQRNLAGMPAAVESAQWLAKYLNQIEGVETRPSVPQTNLFHLLVPGDPAELLEYACRWSAKHQALILPVPRAHEDGRCVMEFSLGRALRSQSRAQWEALLQDFFGKLPGKSG